MNFEYYDEKPPSGNASLRYNISLKENGLSLGSDEALG